ncbi:MAG: hypothetical protein ACXVAO_07090 [Vulcanimicrobiaceae bacterium]
MIKPEHETSNTSRNVSALLLVAASLVLLAGGFAVSYRGTAVFVAVTIALIAIARWHRFNPASFSTFLGRPDVTASTHVYAVQRLSRRTGLAGGLALLFAIAVAVWLTLSLKAPLRDASVKYPGAHADRAIAQMLEQCPALSATVTPRDAGLTSFNALLRCASRKTQRSFVARSGRSGLAVSEVELLTPHHTMQIEARDLPLDAFYQAAHAQGLQRSPFRDKESIYWSVNADDLAAFSYVTPAFLRYRSLLAPFLGLRSAGALVWALLIFVIYWLFDKLVMPIVSDWVKDWVKRHVQRVEHP